MIINVSIMIFATIGGGVFIKTSQNMKKIKAKHFLWVEVLEIYRGDRSFRENRSVYFVNIIFWRNWTKIDFIQL